MNSTRTNRDRLYRDWGRLFGGHALKLRAACLVAGLALLAGPVQAQNPLQGVVKTNTAPDDLFVEIAGDLVTVTARDVTVKELLEEIARQSGLVLILHEPLEESVAMELDRLPLPEAISRILSGQNYTLQYVRPSSDKAKLSETSTSRLFRVG